MCIGHGSGQKASNMVNQVLGSHFPLLLRYCDFITFRILHLLPGFLFIESQSVFLSLFVWSRLLAYGPLRGVLPAGTCHSLGVRKVDPDVCRCIFNNTMITLKLYRIHIYMYVMKTYNDT